MKTTDKSASPSDCAIPKRKLQFCTTTELRTIKKMWEKGASYKKIAETLGCTPLRVKGIRQTCRLPPRKSGRPPIDGVARPRTTHALDSYLKENHPEEYERRRAHRREQESERRRRIREDPEKYAEYTAKRREMWHKRYQAAKYSQNTLISNKQ